MTQIACADSLRPPVATLLTAACGYIGATRSWTESVQLDDGSMIKIKRYVKFKRYNSWAGDAPSAEDLRATLSFTGELSDLLVWDVPLTPMVLYQDARKEWVIVAGTDRCQNWFARGKPFPPYWEYRLIGGRWLERPLSDSSKGHATNPFMGYRMKPLPAHVDVKRKRALISDPNVDEYDRRIVAEVRRYCMTDAPSQPLR